MIKGRRSVVVVSFAVLLALMYAIIDRSAPEESRAHPQAVAAKSSGVFTMSAAAGKPLAQPMPRISHVANPEASQPPPLPFSFLGRITEGGRTTILLYAGGRTLRVRGTGPLDDDYEVEAIRDDHLVLRYVRLGAQQVLALASRQYLIPGALATDTPQD